ncbi:MAG TPA: glycosyltransferase [Gaiellaceae bacterium]|nr:glycosyltransferase [Gaiellaceae bacterium]
MSVLPRVALAHEWLVRYAGSERVVEELLVAFPGSGLITTLVRPAELPPSLRQAAPSFLQRVPGATRRHEWLLPLMPLAWSLRRPLDDVDAVISSSHACAKAVRIAPGIPHVSYCHTPMRYAWDFDAEAGRVPGPARPLAAAVMVAFRRWDRRTAERVTRFVANSNAVAARIRRFYGRDAEIVFPPVRTDYFTFDGERERSSFLYVGRLVSYKRPDLVVEAFRGLRDRLVVVGDGHMRQGLEARASGNVTFLGEVSLERLRELYRSAVALVYPAEEDFGIVMAEAQACGTPVIGYRLGGAADIVAHGETGWLVERQELGVLRQAIRRAARAELDRAGIAERARRFSGERFRREMRRIVDEEIAERRRR